MELNELEQLKRQYNNGLERLNRVKELLNTEQVKEFFGLSTSLISEYDSLDEYMSIAKILAKLRINELELMKKILANFKFTSTNNIYVCVGAYFCKVEPAYFELPPKETYPHTTYINSNYYICRNYRNLEDERDFYVYRTEEAWENHRIVFGLDKPTWPTSEFEEKHIVLNPYNSDISDNGYEEVRAEFFLDCMTMSQEESKQRLLKKYNRM